MAADVGVPNLGERHVFVDKNFGMHPSEVRQTQQKTLLLPL
ncbi:hypothetical protein [Arthrobacter pigmenti]